MLAVVEVAGKQVKIAEKDRILVPLMKKSGGAKVTLDRVLLYENGNTVSVGNPTVKGISVEAEVLGERTGDKTIVFKKKKRKGYRVKKGHRQRYTEIEITKIVG
jgi:large subunit ribosomal protein L21